MIRVGRCVSDFSGNLILPELENFTPVVVMTKSRSKWWPLSPYELKDAQGRILENIWQFSKIYAHVPYSCGRKPVFAKGSTEYYDQELLRKWRNT